MTDHIEIINKRRVSTRVGLRDDGLVYLIDHTSNGGYNLIHPCAAISIWYKLGELFGVTREDARELLENRYWRGRDE